MEIKLSRTKSQGVYRVKGHEHIMVTQFHSRTWNALKGSVACVTWTACDWNQPSLCLDSGKALAFTRIAEAGSLGSLKTKLAKLLAP